MRPPTGGAPVQPWSPDPGGGGITCPTCGLHNDPGARVCRNCGLPIAGSEDPLRGVSPGHVEMPSAQRAGLSATVGLAIVVGLLLVSGTLAVSGGGILSGGGRIGVGPDVSPSASADAAEVAPGAGTGAVDTSATDTGGGAAADDPPRKIGTATGFTCGSATIRDPGKGKWQISRPVASASNDEFDRLAFELVRNGPKKAKSGLTVRLEWLDPKEARERFDIKRVPGERALVITFEGPGVVPTNSFIESRQLEREGMASMRQVEFFDGEGDLAYAVVGVDGEGCARVVSPQWKKTGTKTARIHVDLKPE